MLHQIVQTFFLFSIFIRHCSDLTRQIFASHSSKLRIAVSSRRWRGSCRQLVQKCSVISRPPSSRASDSQSAFLLPHSSEVEKPPSPRLSTPAVVRCHSILHHLARSSDPVSCFKGGSAQKSRVILFLGWNLQCRLFLPNIFTPDFIPWGLPPLPPHVLFVTCSLHFRSRHRSSTEPPTYVAPICSSFSLRSNSSLASILFYSAHFRFRSNSLRSLTLHVFRSGPRRSLTFPPRVLASFTSVHYARYAACLGLPSSALARSSFSPLARIRRSLGCSLLLIFRYAQDSSSLAAPFVFRYAQNYGRPADVPIFFWSDGRLHRLRCLAARFLLAFVVRFSLELESHFLTLVGLAARFIEVDSACSYPGLARCSSLALTRFHSSSKLSSFKLASAHSEHRARPGYELVKITWFWPVSSFFF